MGMLFLRLSSGSHSALLWAMLSSLPLLSPEASDVGVGKWTTTYSAPDSAACSMVRATIFMVSSLFSLETSQRKDQVGGWGYQSSLTRGEWMLHSSLWESII